MKKFFYVFFLLFCFNLFACITYAKLTDAEFVKYCETGSFENINKMLIEGADVNAKVNFADAQRLNLPLYSTPLSAAIIKNPNDNIAKLLIEKGAFVNSTIGFNDITPLISAISYKRSLSLIKYLVEHGADVNKKSKYFGSSITMSVYYTDSEQLELIQYLVSKGAQINSTNSHGDSILSLVAGQKSKKELIRFLINNGADVNINSNNFNSPLIKAIKYSTPEIVELLVKNGANIYGKSENGKTIIENSIDSITPDVLDKLISLGYEFSTPADSVTELDKLLLSAVVYNKNPQILQKLIDLGADVNFERYKAEVPLKDSNNYCHYQWTDSPLLSAVRTAYFDPTSSIEKIKILLENGASLTPIQKYSYYCPMPRNGVYISPSSIIEIAQKERQRVINFNGTYYHTPPITKTQVIKLYDEIIDLLNEYNYY